MRFGRELILQPIQNGLGDLLRGPFAHARIADGKSKMRPCRRGEDGGCESLGAGDS